MRFEDIFFRQEAVAFALFFNNPLHQLNVDAHCAERVFNFVRHARSKTGKPRHVFHAARKHLLTALLRDVFNLDDVAGQFCLIDVGQERNGHKTRRAARSGNGKFLRHVRFAAFSRFFQKPSDLRLGNKVPHAFRFEFIFIDVIEKEEAVGGLIRLQDFPLPINDDQSRRQRIEY